MNCICKKIEKGEKEYVSHGDWNSIAIERDEYGEYYIVAIGDGKAYLKLNYCPKCGRGLNDE